MVADIGVQRYGWTMPTTVIRSLAPEAIASFEQAVGVARSAIDAGIYDPVRARVADLLGVHDPVPADAASAERCAAVADWPTSPLFGDADRAVMAFTEQYIVDVAAVTDDQRSALTGALGDRSATFSQALYTIDYDLRVRAALRQLFGQDLTHHAAAQGELWPTLEVMLVAIAKLHRLDPMTTELVRLRGARVHNCRFCKSVRNVRAADQAGHESFFDQVDRYATSDLTDAQKTALRLTDAIYFSPAHFPDGLVTAIHQHFEPAQVMEIVLDIARNALNKSAVALGADGAGVGPDLHYYDTTPSGELVYGLTPSAQRGGPA